MEYSFDNLKNKYKNIPCIIVSPGPKLKHFNFKKFKGKILCIGDSILRGRNIFNADFWVCANNEFPNPNIHWHLRIINKFKRTFFVLIFVVYRFYHMDALKLPAYFLSKVKFLHN